LALGITPFPELGIPCGAEERHEAEVPYFTTGLEGLPYFSFGQALSLGKELQNVSAMVGYGPIIETKGLS
jgi:hypothetical protein